jgi:hypothetical protein
MALNNPTTLAYPPLQVPMVGPDGKPTQQWAMWFQQMYIRIGGSTPVNPNIKTQTLISAYPPNFYLVPAGQTFIFNGITYTAGQIIPFYQSGIGVSTVIDSLTVQNQSAVAGTLSVYVVPYNNLPSPANLLVDSLPIPVSTIPAAISQMASVQVGSGGYLAVTASPSMQLLCTLSGRLLT